MYAFLIPYCLGGIAGPTLQGIISNQVPETEQGELQGAITSLTSLSAIIGLVVMPAAFYYFTQADNPLFFPGAAFVLGAAIAMASLFFVVKSLSKFTGFAHKGRNNTRGAEVVET